MKVDVVHSFYSSGEPSGENAVVELQVEALKASGHEVRLHSVRTDDLVEQPGYALRSGLRVATGFGRNPLHAIKESNADVVHVHNLFPNMGTHWLASCPAPVVATLHNYRNVCASGLLWRDGHACTECLDSSSLRAVQHGCYRDSALASLPLAISTSSVGHARKSLSRFDSLITLNSEARDVFGSLVGFDKVNLIPNFVASPESLARERDDVWVYVGRFTREKGILKLIADFPESESLLVVGAGPLDSEVDRAVALRANVNLLGRLPHRHVLDILARAKGLLIPSQWSEGVPTVALEALAQGTPLAISSQVSSAASLVDGGAGVVYSTEGGAHSLHAALNHLRADWERMSKEARLAFETRYSARNWVQKVEEVYVGLLGSRRRP
ncbi:glycosyltransferase family 4 protein [Rhodococcus sp. NPDC003994]